MLRPHLLVLLAALALPLGCAPTTSADDDDDSMGDDDDSSGDDDDDDSSGDDDDDSSGDDDDDDDDDDDTSSSGCWEAESILDVSVAPGPGPGYPAPSVEGRCDGDTFVIETNSIPHFTFLPTTPNELVATEQTWELPRNPTVNASPTEIPLLGNVAITVTGLPIFGPNEAEVPDPYGDPVYNGIVDPCQGHTATVYHNHALWERCFMEEGLVAEPWTLPPPPADEPSGILGWAADGFPIYGPRGCLDADCTEVVEHQSGWQRIGDPSTYAWDAHEYVPSDDPAVLDQCNGHYDEDGNYHYHATATFPYVLGCYMGTPVRVGGGGGGGGGGGRP